jgi:YidC/Oxa1 family membrane protein insertase
LDRKAWIVIVLCCLGLYLNLNFSKKNAEAVREQEALIEKESPEGKEGAPAAVTAPATGGEEAAAGSEGSVEATKAPEADPLVQEKTFKLSSSGAVFTFTNFGGGIKRAEMSGQFAVQDKENLVSLNESESEPIGRLTTGVDQYLDLVYAHVEEWDTDTSISFVGKTREGLQITKTWTVEKQEARDASSEDEGASFRLKLNLEFENTGEGSLNLQDYGLFAGSAAPLWKGEWDRHITLFYQKDGDYKKRRVVKFKKGKKPHFKEDAGVLGFAGVSNQFFATIISPENPYDAWVWGDRRAVQLPGIAGGGSGESIRLGMSLPEKKLTPGGDNKEALTFDVYIGPKNSRLLGQTGEEHDRDYAKVMNYGLFSPISNFLNWLLNGLFSKIFSKVSDSWGWGFSIVVLTIIIRGAMWPLQNKSTRAMKRMSKLQPEIKELREKYADDPNRQNQEMMKMYRDYGINPLGGCLPLLVQIPIFFGFYIMLQYAVELRQQPFLWVEDLALPDTVATLPFALPFLGEGVNLLPIVMAVTMVLQMALTPKTGDKMQRRLFMMMPVIFFFFCYNFASALALYWTTSNIFAIVQMLITRRLPDPELKKKRGAAKKGFFQKLQERAEEAQKTQKAMRSRQMGGQGPKKPKKRGPRTGG